MSNKLLHDYPTTAVPSHSACNMYEFEQPLLHVTLNPSCQETILFVHGAFSNYLEWKRIAEHIPNYRILIPSLALFEDSNDSKAVRPMTLSRASALLAQLIHVHAANARAHVVGFSLGARMAVDLASKYPEIVDTLFVSGFATYEPLPAIKPILACLTFTAQSLTRLIPASMVSHLMSGTVMDYGGPNTCTISSCRDVISMLSSTEEIQPVRARTLVVVAGKSGVLPTSDSVPRNRQMFESITEPPGNQESKMMRAPNMRHPWHLQDSKLFADCVVAWIEKEQIPDELQPF